MYSFTPKLKLNQYHNVGTYIFIFPNSHERFFFMGGDYKNVFELLKCLAFRVMLMNINTGDCRLILVILIYNALYNHCISCLKVESLNNNTNINHYNNKVLLHNMK